MISCWIVPTFLWPQQSGWTHCKMRQVRLLRSLAELWEGPISKTAATIKAKLELSLHTREKPRTKVAPHDPPKSYMPKDPDAPILGTKTCAASYSPRLPSRGDSKTNDVGRMEVMVLYPPLRVP